MIAYALYHDYDDITLVGVDVAYGSEYTFERPSIAYWCGIASACNVTVHWDVLEPCFLYGYEGEELDKILQILNQHIDMAHNEFTAETDQRKKDQWAGYLFAVKKILNEIKG
jgi:hypothetical protein